MLGGGPGSRALSEKDRSRAWNQRVHIHMLHARTWPCNWLDGQWVQANAKELKYSQPVRQTIAGGTGGSGWQRHLLTTTCYGLARALQNAWTVFGAWQVGLPAWVVWVAGLAGSPELGSHLQLHSSLIPVTNLMGRSCCGLAGSCGSTGHARAQGRARHPRARVVQAGVMRSAGAVSGLHRHGAHSWAKRQLQKAHKHPAGGLRARCRYVRSQAMSVHTLMHANGALHFY